MKTLFCFFLALVGATLTFAQPAESSDAPKRTPDELQKLVSPIAIYPDALIGIILPASTASSDIVLASRYLASNGDPSQLDKQSWDASVVALARYPEVIKWMDQNLEWTRQLGEAFAAQPSDVMSAIQTLRNRAQHAGLLQSTPQQQVTVSDGEVYIEPTSPDVIYVPEYDPDVIYYSQPVYSPWLSFSAGFAAGAWLDYSCDWGRRGVYVYHHPVGWRYQPGWYWRDHGNVVAARPWHPSPNYARYNQRMDNRVARHPVQHVEPPHFNAPSTHRDGAPDSRHFEERPHTSYNNRIAPNERQNFQTAAHPSTEGQRREYVPATNTAPVTNARAERVGALTTRQYVPPPRAADAVPRAVPAAPHVAAPAAPVQHYSAPAQHASSPPPAPRSSGGDSHDRDSNRR